MTKSQANMLRQLKVVVKQNNKIRFFIYFVLIVGLFFLTRHILTRKCVIHWYKTRSCLKEVLYKSESFEIQAVSKEEIVQAFINAYDIHWDRESIEDPADTIRDWYTCRNVHKDIEPQLGSALKWMATAKVVKITTVVKENQLANIHTGHQAKLHLHFDDGSVALFKTKWFEREEIIGGVEKGKMGNDRHNGEIAAYHLQRILGFNRAPLVVGRKLDIAREVLPVADEYIIKNTFIKDDTNMCIRFKMVMGIKETRTKTDEMCADGTLLEGAVVLWLPQPFSTSWFKNPSLAAKQNQDFIDPKANKLILPLNEEVKLFDYIDALLLDYLIQNIDRHAVDFVNADFSSILLVDNGKSFGDPTTDYPNVLEVFKTRCQVRNSTYVRLRLLRDGVLSEVLRHILSHDPIAPVLWDPHYEALDRRLTHMLNTIDECINVHSREYVLRNVKLPTQMDKYLKLKHLVW